MDKLFKNHSNKYLKPKKIYAKCKKCGYDIIFYGKQDRIRCIRCNTMNEAYDNKNAKISK